jgi:bifunctional non-homologous end joining protein LigD
MTLAKYRAKRNFRKSPEPKGGKGGRGLIFVVQKHYASHLHYDVRLQHKGALVSWAVPKGPPRTAGIKRLAIHVEDHPLDYARFEGVIPKGNYGAGKVEIWDKGTYLSSDTASKAESERRFAEGMKKGHIAVVLQGKKLKGQYDLIRLKRGPKDNAWLLIKRASKKS